MLIKLTCYSENIVIIYQRQGITSIENSSTRFMKCVKRRLDQQKGNLVATRISTLNDRMQDAQSYSSDLFTNRAAAKEHECSMYVICNGVNINSNNFLIDRHDKMPIDNGRGDIDRVQ